MEELTSVLIFEIMGRPPEHISKALEKFVEDLSKITGVEILNKKLHEPKPLEKEGVLDYYIAFAEVEVKCQNLALLVKIVLNMLPANVEIIRPGEFILKNYDINTILSDLTVKVHRYDEVAKVLMLEREKTSRRIKELEDKIIELGGEVPKEESAPIGKKKEEKKKKESKSVKKRKPKEKKKKNSKK